MSIASEISRLQSAKASIKTSIENKGVSVPSSAKLDGYSSYIDAISSGSATLITKTITANGTYNASSDNADGYSQVTASVPNTYTATISGTSGGPSDPTQAYVIFNGVTYDTDGGTFTFNAGDTLTGYAKGQTSATIYVNDSSVAHTTSGAAATYNYTLPEDDILITIESSIAPYVSLRIEQSRFPTGTLTVSSTGTKNVRNYAYIETASPLIVPTGSTTISSNGTVDVTSFASAIVNVAGLPYETGTYTTSSDIARPTISFAKTHSHLPMFIAMTDVTQSAASSSSNLSFIYYDPIRTFDSGFYYGSNLRYGFVYYVIVGSNGSGSQGQVYFSYPSTNTGSGSTSYPRYWVNGANFKPYSNSSSRYWRTGRTYKWIAIWDKNDTVS